MSIANAIRFAIAVANRTCDSYVQTNGRTNEEVTTSPLKSFTSVPRTRIPRDLTLASRTAALRASLIRQEPADV